MYSLIDASGMYASCEKIYDPSIRHKATAILSNNDGAIIAVCPIAKRLGVPKFKPYFQVKEELTRLGVEVRSSNYELYASISQNMMDVCASFAPEQHVYSIDECFQHYGHYEPQEGWYEHGMNIRRKVWKHVRLPVGVGFGSTPTLAKAANHASKKLPGFKGVAVIDNEKVRESILRAMSVTDVWGVGRRIGKRLNLMGIESAWQLAQARPRLIKNEFSILLESTVHELNGIVKLTWDEVRAPKKEIFSTRSFGQRVTTIEDLRQALTTHLSIAAEKLRKQNSLAKVMLVFASNSPHDTEPYFRRSLTYHFPASTADTLVMSKVIPTLVDSIFREGVRFYRCGVGLMDLSQTQLHQPDLFVESQDNPKLMECMDQINARYGRETVHLASKGIDQKFAMRRELLSPQYTTRLKDIPVIYC